LLILRIGAAIKNRITTAVSGVGAAFYQSSNIELDLCEYYVQIHPSGHFQIELPEHDLAYQSVSNIENELIPGVPATKF